MRHKKHREHYASYDDKWLFSFGFMQTFDKAIITILGVQSEREIYLISFLLCLRFTMVNLNFLMFTVRLMQQVEQWLATLNVRMDNPYLEIHDTQSLERK